MQGSTHRLLFSDPGGILSILHRVCSPHVHQCHVLDHSSCSCFINFCVSHCVLSILQTESLSWLILSIILTSFLWTCSYFFLLYYLLSMLATFHILNLFPLSNGSGLVGMMELKFTVNSINQSHKDGQRKNKWVGRGLECWLGSLRTPSFSERWRIHYLCLRLTTWVDICW